jgi:hypothetical protein
MVVAVRHDSFVVLLFLFLVLAVEIVQCSRRRWAASDVREEGEAWRGDPFVLSVLAVSVLLRLCRSFLHVAIFFLGFSLPSLCSFMYKIDLSICHR